MASAMVRAAHYHKKIDEIPHERDLFASRRTADTPSFHPYPIRRLPRRRRLARGAALPASARALRLGAGAAARLALYFCGGLSLRARRLDHSALRHLRAL